MENRRGESGNLRGGLPYLGGGRMCRPAGLTFSSSVAQRLRVGLTQMSPCRLFDIDLGVRNYWVIVSTVPGEVIDPELAVMLRGPPTFTNVTKPLLPVVLL